MAIAPTGSVADRSHAIDLLTVDFCPWANRYVYWLREPIGWFVIAFLASLLVGLHVSPIGWVLASILAGVIAVGVAWPWVAVRAASCRLSPTREEVHEEQACELTLSVRNRCPFPLWGLAIEGYLDSLDDDIQPTVALACVPMLSDAEYRLRVAPKLRGRYPVVAPQITCSMPFGLWTARRELTQLRPLDVLPRISPVKELTLLAGGRAADGDEHHRAGQSGEQLGVRGFRGGDRLRNVHWVQTARTDTLMVCERAESLQTPVDLILDASLATPRDEPQRLAYRQSLARRVRVAASLAVAMHNRRMPVRLIVGNVVLPVSPSPAGRQKLLRTLAEVPADGLRPRNCLSPLPNRDKRLTLRVLDDPDGSVGAVLIQVNQRYLRIESDQSLDHALARFSPEVLDVA